MKRRILIIMLMLMYLCTIASAKNLVNPQASTSYNGLLSDGTSIYNVEETFIIPRVPSRTFRYISGTERLTGFDINHTFARIYGTSIEFPGGTNVSYTFSRSYQCSKQTEWNITGSLEGEFNISVVKANLMVGGGYSSSETATIYIGESYTANLQEAGLYELTWYMRSHTYYVQCDAEVLSTGADAGTIVAYTLGTVEFPTQEIHFDITRS